MTDRELEQKLKTAMEHAAPHQLDAILSATQNQKGRVSAMTDKNNSKRFQWKPVAAVAAALVLVLGGMWAGFSMGRQQPGTADVTPTQPGIIGVVPTEPNPATPAPVIPDPATPAPVVEPPVTMAAITFDVNPSVELIVGEDETVIEAVALNADGKAVLGDMELKGVNLETATNALVGAFLTKGYLNELQNAILVSVETREGASAGLEADLAAKVSAFLKNSGLSGAVLSQTIPASDGLSDLAVEYGVSRGKAALMQEIVAQDATLTYGQLSQLSITQLAALSEGRNLAVPTVSQTGMVSDQGYIGLTAALKNACAHVGVSSAKVLDPQTELDCEDGVMVYEVEFCYGGTEYDLEVDALSGAIRKSKNEPCDHARHTSGGQGGTQTAAPSDYIGTAAALSAAQAKANLGKVASSQLQGLKTELDIDDGKAVYEVDFCYGGTEYEVEVDAVTAAVLKYSTEPCDHAAHQAAPAPTSGQSSGTSTGYIGESKALSIAYAHAGVNSANTRKVECKLDREDGVMVYEIEFEAGVTEYEYEIDAVTGNIIHYEWDND